MKTAKIKDEHLRQLYKAVLTLESEEECRNFFFDICTIGELHSLAQRLEVARLLQEGVTYQKIEEITGASTATISRVKRFLYYGAGGYEAIFKRLNPENETKED